MTESKGVADHPERGALEEMWREGSRASAINEWLEQQGYSPLKTSTLARYGQRYWSDAETVKVEVDPEDDLAGQLQELSKLGVVKKMSVRNSVTAAGAETSSTVIEVTPSTSVPVLERAPASKIKLNYKVAKAETKPDGWKVGVKLPDMQIGYWSDGKQKISTHDEAAIDVAHQIMADVHARYGLDLVMNVGDNLDLPAFGSHRNAPGFKTTQLAIDRAAIEGATQRAIAPDADIIWISGNHEARLTNFLVDKAPDLLGLARGGDTEPVVSIQNLCRFDENDITFLEGYPDAEYWVNEHLRFEHGSLYSSTPGGTAAKHLSSGVSVGYGHIHRQEMLQTTRHTKNGPRTNFAGSAGCLCKIDGAVPSAKTGITSNGKQSMKKHENWQNGIWVFWWQPDGDQLVAVEPISIWGGWSMFRGTEIRATCDPDGNPF